VPSLRHRSEDIPLLIQDIVARMEAANRGSVRLSPACVAALMRYEWPGNVRELANLIERLAIIHPGGLINAADLPEKFRCFADLSSEAMADPEGAAESVELAESAGTDKVLESAMKGEGVALPEQGIDLKKYLDTMEIHLIRQALEESNGIVAHAAKRLNLRRTTLVEKLRKLDLQF
jgi:sigma-54 specific flagellar transcriptional regulator A